jgi:hypothetical protein
MEKIDYHFSQDVTIYSLHLNFEMKIGNKGKNIIAHFYDIFDISL